MKPIALIIPWYGDGIRGGAEQECNYLAHSLQAADTQVEVFTTCVRDAASDRGINTMPSGMSYESGIPVRRFPVRIRNSDAFTEANLKIYHNRPFTLEDERTYFKEDINSPHMYTFIREHKDDYRCFIFIPYMYGPTYNGIQECAEKAVMIPCLHDESYAYMRLVKESVEACHAIIFHARPESELAHRLFNLSDIPTAVLGECLDTDWSNKCDAEAFRQKYGIEGDFILFAGRKDAGKKADELLQFFTQYLNRNQRQNLKLVLIGGGNLPIPEDFTDKIIDLGFVSSEDKHNAFAACVMLCNPSHFESFSLVIMESWLAKRPVIVSEHCAVTSHFCLETNGGLFYQNFVEFEACINYLLNHADQANQMGENGYTYVMEHFTSQKIAANYLTFIEQTGL